MPLTSPISDYFSLQLVVREEAPPSAGGSFLDYFIHCTFRIELMIGAYK